jgi:hypothetical protein
MREQYNPPVLAYYPFTCCCSIEKQAYFPFRVAHGLTVGWVKQSKVPEARHVVMNEMVFASGMETTALMNEDIFLPTDHSLHRLWDWQRKRPVGPIRRLAHGLTVGWVKQSKVPEARHVVMKEMVFASGMETTALMNDYNTQMRCSKTIQMDICRACHCNSMGIRLSHQTRNSI